MQSEALPAKTSWKAQLYASPFIGYSLKLLVSLFRLPVRLKQIYDHIDRLIAASGQVRSALETLELKQRIAVRDVAEKNNALWQELALLKELNHRVTVETQGFRSEFQEKLTQALERVTGLQGRVASATGTMSNSSSAPATPEAMDSAFYAAFERAFRNDQTSLLKHFEGYRPYLSRIPSEIAQLDAVDLGCGRGEWLEVLQSWGIEAKGVDPNSATNTTAQTKNLKILENDALSYLIEQESRTLKLVSSFHLVEHLTPPYLMRLMQESFRALAPGGLLIVETPNPENVLVGACNFYMDFTHQKPIPPAALGFLLSYCGFQQLDCLRFHPLVSPYEGSDPLIQRLSELISKGQDYAIIAQKPLLS